ncbi:MAG: hypothetical protein HP491_16995 [Nitrospira sp.]|nr:hypothetical protein [Nitrospira sp.]MBH0181959.1 hypothetical protein [Nitrospira sp.]MBH0184121.1 hypothetical protein [Nitrospira sp.]
MNSMNSNSESRRPCLRAHRWLSEWQKHTVLTAIVLVLLTPSVSSISPAFAEQNAPVGAVPYHEGNITGVYETTIQINQKTFSLVPKVVILDRHNDPLSERDIRVDLEVKYHLLKGTTDKIDQMIVFLPE